MRAQERRLDRAGGYRCAVITRGDLVWRFTLVAAGLALLAAINRDLALGLYAAVGAVVFATLALVLHLTRPRRRPD